MHTSLHTVPPTWYASYAYTKRCLFQLHILATHTLVVYLWQGFLTISKSPCVISLIGWTIWWLLFVHCVVLGDLLYIDVVTLEDVQVNITASTSGFFVNRSVFSLHVELCNNTFFLCWMHGFCLFFLEILLAVVSFSSHTNIDGKWFQVVVWL